MYIHMYMYMYIALENKFLESMTYNLKLLKYTVELSECCLLMTTCISIFLSSYLFILFEQSVIVKTYILEVICVYFFLYCNKHKKYILINKL